MCLNKSLKINHIILRKILYNRNIHSIRDSDSFIFGWLTITRLIHSFHKYLDLYNVILKNIYIFLTIPNKGLLNVT